MADCSLRLILDLAMLILATELMPLVDLLGVPAADGEVVDSYRMPVGMRGVGSTMNCSSTKDVSIWKAWMSQS